MKENTQKVNKIVLIRDIIIPSAIMIFICYLILSVFRLTIVDGNSMNPTFENNQKLFLNRIAYFNKTPERGDVVLANPKELGGMYIIKRVIGVPGDTIEIKDNVLYVNDEPLTEDYLYEEMINENIEKFRLLDDEYFLCGDNRNNSLDSRAEMIGNIQRDEIIGKLIFNFNTFEVIN